MPACLDQQLCKFRRYTAYKAYLFRLEGLGFRVWGLGSWVWGFGLRFTTKRPQREICVGLGFRV